MKRIETHDAILALLRRDVEETEMKRIVVQAGHFPLNYDSGSNSLVEDLDIWGEFSEYTFELGCEAARFALDIGKITNMIFLCDDHTYSPDHEASRKQKGFPQWKRMIKKFYQLKSGKDAKLPEKYERILAKYAIPREIIRRHDHGKFGRRECIYHSENILRNNDRDLDSNCAREYAELLDSRQFDEAREHLVSFVPRRCTGHICDALGAMYGNISASHVFMESMGMPTRETVYQIGIGVTYRRDKREE